MTFKLKLIAAALAVGGAFVAGWVIQGWRMDAALKDAHEAATEQLVETITAERQKAARLIDEAAEKSRQHESVISSLRSRIENLQGDIANARLESRTAATVEADGAYSCPDPTHSSDFVRLWNAASSPDSGRAAATETSP